MRIEYSEEQERKLRITEIEAILENNLFEDADEELTLQTELTQLTAKEQNA